MRRLGLIMSLLLAVYVNAYGGELNARVVVNHSKIQGTNVSVFDDLQKNIEDFLNNRNWTGQQYEDAERISCNFNITVNKYDEMSGCFEASLLLNAYRPVFNSSYTTVVYSVKDEDFNFDYHEFDKLNFRVDQIDNELTAMLGYYAYFIIGMDNDAMSLLGGTKALQTAHDIAVSAQSLNGKGWKSIGSDKNRYALINDLLDGSMEPFRKMQYTYYRLGLDIMADDVEKGKENVTQALKMLSEAHKNKRQSKLPQLFTEYKRDEIVNIYSSSQSGGKSNDELQNLLSDINSSYNSYWKKLLK